MFYTKQGIFRLELNGSEGFPFNSLRSLNFESVEIWLSPGFANYHPACIKGSHTILMSDYYKEEVYLTNREGDDVESQIRNLPHF